MAEHVGGNFRIGGVAVAGIGFSLTRFVVAESVTISGSAADFLLTAVPPLVLGFVLTLFGVGLAVSTLADAYVRVIALWCLLGTGGMIVILGLTLVNPMEGGFHEIPAPVVGNVLLGGAIGGTLIGIRSAENRQRRRDLERQRDQATLLNRVLRDEVINAVTVISGRAETLASSGTADGDRLETIEASTDRIVSAISYIGFIVRTPTVEDRTSIDIASVLEERLSAAREDHPDAIIRLDGDRPAGLTISADRDITTAIDRLIELAADRSESTPPRVTVAVSTTPRDVRLMVTPEDAEFTSNERRVLESGRVAGRDDPRVDFRVSIVGLLMNRYDGRVDIGSGPSPTITVSLPQAVGVAWGPDWSAGRYGVSPMALRNVAVASILGGIAMGIVTQGLAGEMPVIGSLYGIENVVVGWISHLFHSLVFGAIFAALLAGPSLHGVDRTIGRCTVFGIGYGVVLWFVAAGIVMPLWLTILGYSTPIPDLNAVNLLGHVLWGAIVGAVYAFLPE